MMPLSPPPPAFQVILLSEMPWHRKPMPWQCRGTENRCRGNAVAPKTDAVAMPPIPIPKEERAAQAQRALHALDGMLRAVAPRAQGPLRGGVGAKRKTAAKPAKRQAPSPKRQAPGLHTSFFRPNPAAKRPVPAARLPARFGNPCALCVWRRSHDVAWSDQSVPPVPISGNPCALYLTMFFQE